MFSLTTAATALSLFAASANAYTSYTTVTGFFLQDDTNTTASGFDYVSQPDLRLIQTNVTNPL